MQPNMVYDMNEKTTTTTHQFFRIETLASGVKVLWLDVPGKVNVLKLEVILELDAILNWLANDATLKGLIITSAKPSAFIAGADVNEIQELQRLSTTDSFAKTQKAKETFGKLRMLGVPTVAAINGACKGGGLELALWCTRRIASNDIKVVLGLPEVRLGVAPGFGGCVLLPRITDTLTAVKMIASGSDMGAAEAFSNGIVDEICSKDELIAQAERLALNPGHARKPVKKTAHAPASERIVGGILNLKNSIAQSKPKATKRKLGALLHNFTAQKVVAEIKRKSRGYCAPWKAANIALKTLLMPLPEALAFESAEFAKLAMSSEARNLVSLFLNRSRTKRLVEGVTPQPFKSVGVVGAGVMGREIAFEAIFSDEIEQVLLIDVKEEFLEKARNAIAALMASRVKSRKTTEEDASAKLAKLTTATSYSALVDCDVVIEAVLEHYHAKANCYRMIDEVMQQRAKATPYFIFSNTSALSLRQLSSAVQYPENFAGMHFFNPVSQMGLVEIPTTEKTSHETMATAIAFAGAMGKVALPCRDYPGFIVNAILAPYLVVSSCMLSEGVSPSSLDKAILNFGMPMGPIELMDYVGLDIVASVARTMSEAHGIRLALPDSDVIAKLVERGNLGRKSGRGFYMWENDRLQRDEKTRLPVLNPDLKELLPALATKTMSSEAIQTFLIGAIENEAVRILEAQVVKEAFLIDLAFVISTGFTASLGGPLAHIDQIGVKTFVDLSKDVAQTHDSQGNNWRKNFIPCDALEQSAKSGSSIFDWKQ